MPMEYGILGRFDYGRVWLDDEKSNEWLPSEGGDLWISILILAQADSRPSKVTIVERLHVALVFKPLILPEKTD